MIGSEQKGALLTDYDGDTSDLTKAETSMHIVVGEDTLKNDNLSLLGVFKETGARKIESPETVNWQTSFPFKSYFDATVFSMLL